MDYLETCFMCDTPLKVDDRVVLVLDGTVVDLAEKGNHTTEFEQSEDNYRVVYCMDCYGEVAHELYILRDKKREVNMDNIIPIHLLRNMISRYERYYGLNKNKAIVQIRKDAQALRDPDLKREARLSEAWAGLRKQRAEWIDRYKENHPEVTEVNND